MKKVLVIDDDAAIVEAIQLTLESEGYATETTTEGDETYQKVDEFMPDLIVLDVLLSGMDGRTIARTMKNQDETKHIPIILISAHPSAITSVKDCGAEDFLAKPFDITTLLGKVEEHLAPD